MRILLVGGRGFIGTHLAAELRDHQHAVVQFGGPSESAEHLQPNAAYMTPAWKRCGELIEQAEVVVILAAQVGRQFGEARPSWTIAQNVDLPLRVAQQVNLHQPDARLVYVSTSEVYGDMGHRTAHEDEWDARRQPHNLYGLTKRQGEEVCALYAPRGGLQVIRPSMPYGPGLPHGKGRAAIVNMLWQADTRQRIPVHRGAERSWCWIGDAVAGMRLVIERGAVATTAALYAEGLGCYNVGRDDQGVPMESVARIACRLTGASESLIDVVDAPAAQTVVKRLSTGKLRRLGWDPQVTLRRGMELTLDAARAGWMEAS